jgi:hypothetical protein
MVLGVLIVTVLQFIHSIGTFFFPAILSLWLKLFNGGFRHSFCVCMTLKMSPLVMVFLLSVQDR